MKRIHQMIAVAILSFFCLGSAKAGDSIDQLLPSPHWFFHHADVLQIDKPTREQLDQVFRAAEPDYHAAVAKVESATRELNESLTAEDVNQPVILERMKKLLDAETEVKLIQVQVRTTFMTKLSVGQRQKVRQIAAQRPGLEKIVESKVRRIQQLAEQAKQQGQSIALVQRNMEGIENVIKYGNLEKASSLLDEVIFRLESNLKQEADKDENKDNQKTRNKKNRSERKQKPNAGKSV